MGKEGNFTFELIKSLGKREKIYFRRFANLSHEKDKSYLRLYDLLLESKTFDRAQVLAHFKGESTERHLSSKLLYLEEQIMNSLVNYYFFSRKSDPFPKLIAYLQVLNGKGFSKKGARLLKKAKKAAYKKEDFTSLLKLIEMEEEILFDHGLRDFVNELERIRAERKRVFELMENYSEIRVLKEGLREIVFREELFLSPSQLASCEMLFHPLLKDEDQALSNRAQIYWNYCTGLLGYIRRDFEAGLKQFCRELDLIHQHPDLLPPLIHHQCLSNVMYLSSLVGDQEQFQTAFKELTLLHQQGEVESDYYDYIVHCRSLSLGIVVQDHELLTNILGNTLPLVKKEPHPFSQLELGIILDLMIQALIILEDFPAAFRLIHLWNTHCNHSSQYRIMNLLSLVVFFELDQEELLESTLRTSERFNLRSGMNSQVEVALLQFFDQVLKYPDPQRVHRLAQTLDLELSQLRENPDENVPITFFDFQIWTRGLVKRLKVS